MKLKNLSCENTDAWIFYCSFRIYLNPNSRASNPTNNKKAFMSLHKPIYKVIKHEILLGIISSIRKQISSIYRNAKKKENGAHPLFTCRSLFFALNHLKIENNFAIFVFFVVLFSIDYSVHVLTRASIDFS